MRTAAFAAVLVAALAPVPADAAGGSLDTRIITFGDSREAIKSTPITQRPNRPLHIYGNSVRRRQHRTVVEPARQNVRR